MLTYLGIFVFGIALFSIGTFFRDKGLKILHWIFRFGSLIELSYFAAIRADSVGTDVLFYMKPSFDYAALYHTFFEYWQHYHFELFYALLSYYVQKMTQNSVVFFFILMAIAVFFIILFIDTEKESLDSNLAFCIFVFGFYNLGLNYSRQMIAIAILLFAQRYLVKDDLLRFCFWLVIAFLFHRSSVIILMLIPLYYSYKLRPEMRSNLSLLFIGVFVFLLLFYNKIITVLISVGVLGAKYAVHLSTGLSIPVVITIFHLFLLGVSLALLHSNKIEFKYRTYYVEICIFDFCLLLIGFLSDTAYRLELFTFILVAVMILPVAFKAVAYGTMQGIVWKMLIISAFVLFWYISVVVQNEGQTYPYLTVTSQLVR
jgi:hypothetical protein